MENMAGKTRRTMSSSRLLLIVVMLGAVIGFFNACTHVYTARGVYYRVRKGDSLAGIAKKYRIDLQELAEVNNIENVAEVKEGRSVYIPGVTPSSFARIIEREGQLAQGPRPKKEPPKQKPEVQASVAPGPVIEVDHDRFRWPIEGELSSLFGMRHGRRHDGIDIRAKKGTPVTAAADGEVAYSQRLRGYGNLILVKHDDDFFTVYAHNSVNLVKKGAKIKKGQVISKVGSTGRATGPHLHFEVREGTKSRNPLFFLPKTLYAQKARERGTDYGGPEE